MRVDITEVCTTMKNIEEGNMLIDHLLVIDDDYATDIIVD
jgi:hypothetical protein